MPRELTVSSGDVRLAVEDHGGDGTPLVLVHGSGANLRAWDLLIPLLRDRFRVVAYDLRSHGYTDVSHDQSMAANVADIDAICAELGIEAPIVLGHSWGVPIALAYGKAHPECPGVIALDGITGPFLYGGSASWAELDASLEGEPTAMTAEQLEAWLAVDQSADLELPPGSVWSEWAPTFRRTFRDEGDGRVVAHPTPEESRDLLMVQMGGIDAYELYDGVAGRVLVVIATGSDDEGTGALGGLEGNAIRMGMLERLKRVRPDLQVQIMTCGHAIPFERPQELADLIANFAIDAGR